MWRLTNAARDDLDAISLWGLHTFGLRQAEKYDVRILDMLDVLAANPKIAPERRGHQRVARLMPCEAHNILYVVQGGDVVILRVLHHLQDWFDLL